MTIYQLTADNEKIKVNNPYEIGVLKLLFTILDENKEGKIFIKKSSFDIINEVLKTLTPREEKVIRLRFGINDKEDPFNCVNTKKSYKKIAEEFGVIDRRIKEIETKALRKLRHPSRVKYFANDNNIAFIHIEQSGDFYGIKGKIYDEIKTALTDIESDEDLISESAVYLNLIKPYCRELEIKSIGEKILFSLDGSEMVFQYSDSDRSDIAYSICDKITSLLYDSIINVKLSEQNINILLRKGYFYIRDCIFNQEKILKEYNDFGLTDYADEFYKVFNNVEEILCFVCVTGKQSEQEIFLTEKEAEKLIKYDWRSVFLKDKMKFEIVRADDIVEEIGRNHIDSLIQAQSYLLVCKNNNIYLSSLDDLMDALPDMTESEKIELAYWCGKTEIGFIREIDARLFDIDIDSLDLSAHTYSCLRRAGYTNLSDLADLAEEDLMKIRNLGRRSFEEVLNVIKNPGLYFKSEKQKFSTITEKLNMYIDVEKEENQKQLYALVKTENKTTDQSLESLYLDDFEA